MKVRLHDTVKFADYTNKLRIGVVIRIEYDLIHKLYWIESEGYVWTVTKRKIFEVIK